MDWKRKIKKRTINESLLTCAVHRHTALGRELRRVWVGDGLCRVTAKGRCLGEQETEEHG